VDFQFDETSDRRRIKLCNIADEYTREALAIRVERTCTAENVITVIEQLVKQRGTPKYLRADNGPEMIAWTLRDYCRLASTRTAYIEPARALWAAAGGSSARTHGLQLGIVCPELTGSPSRRDQRPDYGRRKPPR
jgi:putative transposase